MRYVREEIVSRILDLFFSRRDVYARSFIKPDGTMGYAPSCGCSLTCCQGSKCTRWRPLEVTGEAIYTHMAASTLEPFPRTIGSYSLSQDNEVKWIVLDIDAHSSIPISTSIVETSGAIAAYQTLEALCETLESIHIPYYVEESGKGYHIWIFTPLISAEVAYKAAKQIVAMTDDLAADIEIFPKQTSLTQEGFGNLVKLPYGLHWSGRRCCFVNLYHSIKDQWEYLLTMKRVDPQQLQRLAARNDEVTKKHTTTSNTAVSSYDSGDSLLPGPPCVSRMWSARLREGEGRNQVLHQLAVDLRRAGFLDVRDAMEILRFWNEAQIDPLNGMEYENAIQHAYSGARYSYGSERPIIGEYCADNTGCPICNNANSKMWSIVNSTRGIKL